MGEPGAKTPQSEEKFAAGASRLAPLPVGARLAVTLLLLTFGLGYLSAVGSLYWSLKDADGKPGWSLNDALVHYRGYGGQSRLEVMLRGAMFKELSDAPKERQGNFDVIHAWLSSGKRSKEAFQEKVWPIIDMNCTTCHARDPADAEEGQPDSPLESFADAMVFVNRVDTGVSYQYLARMSHTHLFGIGGLVAGLSLILWCTAAPVRWKAWVSCMGFAATVGDIGSWWLIKVSDAFAYLSGLCGMVLGVCLLLFILIPLHDMWIAKTDRLHS